MRMRGSAALVLACLGAIGVAGCYADTQRPNDRNVNPVTRRMDQPLDGDNAPPPAPPEPTRSGDFSRSKGKP